MANKPLTARNQLVSFDVMKLSDPSRKREIEVALLMVCRKETKGNGGTPLRVLIHPTGRITEGDIKLMLLRGVSEGESIIIGNDQFRLVAVRQLTQGETTYRLAELGFKQPSVQETDQVAIRVAQATS